jgi:hypothetical protein
MLQYEGSGRREGVARCLCVVASPPSPYLGWLADNVCVFVTVNEALDISCHKYSSL